MRFTHVPKRLLLGQPMRSDRLGDTLLPKRIALPIFASSPLSAVAYAPTEIFLVLSLAGIVYFDTTLWFALAVSALLLIVIASYRQNVQAYPGGGGDYEVAAANFGRGGGLTVASALVVDYVIAVAVSVSAGIDNLGAAVPFVAEHRVGVALAVIAALMLINLRGIREAGVVVALPVYAFIVAVLVLVVVGLVRALVLDDDLRAPSADFVIRPEMTDLGTLAVVLLVVRAFSSGAVALTGIELSANGVPQFRVPKGRNAALTLAVMGTAAATMFIGLVALGSLTDMRVAADPANNLLINGAPAGPDYVQEPIIAQTGAAVFGDGSGAYVFLTLAASLILFLAANTSFNGFPVLGSILARDRFLPKQLHQRGDRLAFSNGIIVLAVAAGILVYVADADVSQLISLYIVAVFVSFTVGQAGMVRHWTTLLRTETDQRARRRIHRNRAVNATGSLLTGTVLTVVVITQFTDGTWVVGVAMALVFSVMQVINRHYDAVDAELAPPPGGVTLPSRIHGVVLVSRLHTPTLRALAFARATRPDTLVAVTVQTDPAGSAALLLEWAERDIPVPLTVLDSPYREVTRPVLEYVRNVRLAGPRDVVAVFVPEYVVGKWWEQLLHNQTPLRIKARLLFQPGVMVISVPWQLGSARAAAGEQVPPITPEVPS
ncbi:MAG: APC family permease [Sporichthyaceae bacterium]